MKNLHKIIFAFFLLSSHFLLALSQEELWVKVQEIIEAKVPISDELIQMLKEERLVPSNVQAECFIKGNELAAHLPVFDSKEAFIASLSNLPASYLISEFECSHCLFQEVFSHHILSSLPLQRTTTLKPIGMAMCPSNVDEDDDELPFLLIRPLSPGNYGLNELMENHEVHIFYLFGLALGEIHQQQVHHATMHPIEKQNLHYFLDALSHYWQKCDIDELCAQHELEDVSLSAMQHAFSNYIAHKESAPYRQGYALLTDDLNWVSFDPSTQTFSFKAFEEAICCIDNERNPIGNPAFDYLAVMRTLAQAKENTSDLQEAFDRGYHEMGGALPSSEDRRFFEIMSTLQETIPLFMDSFFLEIDTQDQIIEKLKKLMQHINQ